MIGLHIGVLVGFQGYNLTALIYTKRGDNQTLKRLLNECLVLKDKNEK